MNSSEFLSGCRDRPSLTWFVGFLWVITGAAILLALMIVLLSDQLFLALSNYLQIISALAGAGIFLYFWHRCGRPEYLLYAAGGFGLWGISNIAWYINILLGQRNAVFPSLIDMGMIASFLVLSIAFQKGLPKKQIAPHILLAGLVLFLLIPAGVMLIAGINASTLATLLYFFACGSLILIGLNHSLPEYPEILIGTLLFALTFMIYPLREMFFITNPILSVIGTFVSAGFALIAIGLLKRGARTPSS